MQKIADVCGCRLRARSLCLASAITCVVALLSHPTNAATEVWNGATDTAWGTATNWTPNTVPGTLSLAGGELQLANDTALNFGRNITITGDARLTSDRLTASAGVTHTLGALSIGAQRLTIAGGSNVTSGAAGVAVGATTFTAAPVFQTGAISGTGGLTFGWAERGRRRSFQARAPMARVRMSTGSIVAHFSPGHTRLPS